MPRLSKPTSRVARRAKRTVVVLLVTGVVYLGLLVYPDPLFAHSLRGSFITAHADDALPPAMAETLRDAEAHVRTSPLFDPDRPHHVYFCQRGWRWQLLSGANHRAAGVALAPIGRSVFFRRARLDANRMIGASGLEAGGERTLDYYVAHEVTHTMTADFLGPADYYALPIWVREGYADYVGRRASFDYRAVRAQLIEGDPRTDPASGHYLRYVLLVGYELERRGISVAELLRHPRSPSAVEADVLAEE